MLKTLRTQNNVTQIQLSKMFNISERNLRRYEKGELEPTLSLLLLLADYFNCSIDYLTGRTDNPEINK